MLLLPEVVGVKPLMRRRPLAPDAASMGLLERVRALFSTESSEPEPSFSSDIGSGELIRFCFAAERVMGAK